MNLKCLLLLKFLIAPENKHSQDKFKTRVLSQERKCALKYPEIKKYQKEDFTQLLKEKKAFLP